ncbi:hypothetical protein B0A48_04759 [Cryoendolithus antarcticus]|uniref:Uncharacterized protein n=1 Tax=Cryoendolithus antarcticus TaxID=1507870 RepID=A0A1V8TDM6_9PEZI|nr:hypothetical protein B0A48_04759 [Cryoendolithus antarcticus]
MPTAGVINNLPLPQTSPCEARLMTVAMQTLRLAIHNKLDDFLSPSVMISPSTESTEARSGRTKPQGPSLEMPIIDDALTSRAHALPPELFDIIKEYTLQPGSEA